MSDLILITTYIRRDQAAEVEKIASQVRASGVDDVRKSDLIRWCLDEGLERLSVLLPDLLKEGGGAKMLPPPWSE